MRTKIKIAALGAAFVGLMAPTSNAALVQYQYTANIVDIQISGTDVNAANALLANYNIVLGGSAGGSFTLDTSATDFNASANVGRYLQATPQLVYGFGSLIMDTSAAGNASGSSRVDVIDGGGIGDLWGITSNLDFDAPEFVTSAFFVGLTASNGGALNGDGLDQVLPPLSAFDPFDLGSPITTAMEGFLALDGGGFITVRAELRTFTVVPIPAAAWLMFSGLGALAALRRATPSRTQSP